MKKLILALVLAFTTVMGFYFFQNRGSEFSSKLKDDQVLAQLESLIDSYAIEGYINGTVLVADSDGEHFVSSYGNANQTDLAVNEHETVYRIGSVTKIFTATLVVQMIEEGLLQLDAPISDFLKSFSHKNADRMTIKHLLVHSSGLPRDYSALTTDEHFQRRYSTSELVKFIGQEDAEFVPGSKSKYSNLNYTLLAAAIEQVTGDTWQNQLQRRIFKPLKMTRTYVDSQTEFIENKALGYWYTHGIFTKAPEPNMSYDLGGGGIYSTVNDLFKFSRAMLDGSLIPQQKANPFFKEYFPSQGIAWRTKKTPTGFPSKSGRIAWHRGSIKGYKSQITLGLKNQEVVIILNNIGVSPRMDLTKQVFNLFYGRAFQLAQPDDVRRIVKTLRTDGLERAHNHAQELSKNNKKLKGHMEQSLNDTGFALLDGKRFEEAIQVMELNKRLFNKSANAVIALGYGYYLDGQFENASQLCQETLTMDPDNKDAMEVIDLIEKAKKAITPDGN